MDTGCRNISHADSPEAKRRRIAYDCYPKLWKETEEDVVIISEEKTALALTKSSDYANTIKRCLEEETLQLIPELNRKDGATTKNKEALRNELVLLDDIIDIQIKTIRKQLEKNEAKGQYQTQAKKNVWNQISNHISPNGNAKKCMYDLLNKLGKGALERCGKQRMNMMMILLLKE